MAALADGDALEDAVDAGVLLVDGDRVQASHPLLGLERSTPLWYYVLREAELVEDGLRLGPVGGRLVGEVVVGLLQCDTASYLSFDPGWRPTLPSRSRGHFQIVDFLTFAGVDPKSRGQ
jgi:hypothetical protein